LVRAKTSADYADRLFFAHFAIIIFGLVALTGAWHDHLPNLDVLFGLGALLAFVCSRPWCFARLLATSQQFIEWVMNALSYRLERGRACQQLLWFIRRAHLACGAPPCSALLSPLRMGVQAPSDGLETPSFIFVSNRRSSHVSSQSSCTCSSPIIEG
jgi:hypothetical protein